MQSYQEMSKEELLQRERKPGTAVQRNLQKRLETGHVQR